MSCPANLFWRLKELFWVVILTFSLTLNGSIALAATISSVSITGPQSNPTITILGSGFGGQAPTGVTPTGGWTGLDFPPQSLSLSDSAGGGWSAGDEVGSTSANCIGLILQQYSDSQIVYQFGSCYAAFWPGTFNLSPGDCFSVTVNGASFSGIVSYGGAVFPNSFSINGGNYSTGGPGAWNVVLSNTCSVTPDYYMASESSSFSGAVWQPYSTAPEFTLSSGYGNKTVYFKTMTGGVQSSVINASIKVTIAGLWNFTTTWGTSDDILDAYGNFASGNDYGTYSVSGSSFTLTWTNFNGEWYGTINSPTSMSGYGYSEGSYTNWTATTSGSQSPGTLQVTISPTAAVSAGARWSIDGGGWQNSGATVTGLSAGAHSIAFNAVSGWTGPSIQSVTVVSNQSTTQGAIYTASVQLATITVLANPSTGGTVSGGGTFAVGSTDTLYATVNTGWAFTGWSDGNTQNPRTITVFSGGATYTANFQANGQTAAVTVLASPSNGGSVTGSGTFTVGSSQPITATPNSGWTFTGWNDGNTQASRSITVPSSGTTCTASFASGPAVRTFSTSGYFPGSPLTVTLNVAPAITVTAYAVQDLPPTGWSVSNISGGGAFDSATAMVKWGPFFDNTARSLTYQVTPPSSGTGVQTFAGTASFDGVGVSVEGSSSLAQLTTHPADSSADFHVDINEMTAYGAAWKNGTTWPVPPNPIDVNYVTRAGYLWKGGEVYHLDTTQTPPLCWVTGSATTSMVAMRTMSAVVPSTASTATRTLPAIYSVGVPFQVTVSVTPSAGTAAYAVEDTPPNGWVISAIDNGGVWDAVNNQVKWGPYFDNTQRALSYTLTPAAGSTGSQTFAGTASFDGIGVAIAGSSSVAFSPLSSNADLSSLSISAGTLVPGFSSGGVNYSVSVPYGVASVTVYATPEDGAATVQVSGGSSLAVGTNPVTVTVTAQNGSVKTYSIAVARSGPAAPTVGAVAVADAGATVAIVSAPVAANGYASTTYFDYKLTGGYDLYSSVTTLPADSLMTTVTKVFNALSPHTTYRVEATAHNAMGTGVSGVSTFRTLPRTDFNRDGIGDILTVTSGGTTKTLLLSRPGGALVGTLVPGPAIHSPLSFRGEADFDRDGKADWLLMDTRSRKVQVWFMDGLAVKSAKTIGNATVPAGFDIAGAADVNGNGYPDIVLFNQATGQSLFWLLKQSPLAVTATKLGPKLPAGFVIVALDDLNGDGQPDLLLWNPSTDQTRLMLLNPHNGTAAFTTLNGPTIPHGWHLIGADAFTTSDSTDWLLYKPTTRATSVWVMRGATHVSTISGPTVPGGLTPVGTK